MEEIVPRVRAFIFENFLFDEEGEGLDNDASFSEQGIIDSTGFLELTEWLEEEFGFTINDDELLPENLDTVNRVEVFVNKKMAAG